MRKALAGLLYLTLVVGVFLGAQALNGGGATTTPGGPGANGNVAVGSTTLPGDVAGQPGTSTPGDSTTNGSIPGPDGTSPSANNGPVEGGITTKILEAPHNPELQRRVASYLAAKQVNQLAAARIEAYMLVAYYDVKRPGDGPGILSQASPGTEIKEAVHAAAWVAAKITDLPEMQADILEWVEEPTGKTREVVDTVIARAKSDGYSEAVKATPTKFTGALGWVSRSVPYPSGLEPGWGSLKPILGNSGCAVGAPDKASIEAEKSAAVAAAKNATTDVKTTRMVTFTTAALNPLLGFGITYGTFLELQLNNVPEEYEVKFAFGMLGVYDALITTWDAKWEYGIAAPLDLAAVNGSGASVAPSYPSWAAVYASYVEEFIRASDNPNFRHTDTKIADLLGTLQQALGVSGARLYNWSTDVAAGKEVGVCHARAAAAKFRTKG
jgi:hypothetical protein